MSSLRGPALDLAASPEPVRSQGLDRRRGTTHAGGLIELYVALKAKPAAIVLGPAGSGKLAAARDLGARLASPGGMYLQEMIGHAWWASRSAGVAQLTEAQDRFNREKILSMFEEAAGDPAQGRLRVALLSRISPAEWSDLAALASFLASESASRNAVRRSPRRAPREGDFLILATADSAAPAPWDPELLRLVSIVPWGIGAWPESPPAWDVGWPADARVEFRLQSLRTPRAALRRLRRLPGWSDARLKPLLELARTMRAHGIRDVDRAAGEALTYLANGWTGKGQGLFAETLEDNLGAAMRLAVGLAFGPRLEGCPPLPGEAQAAIEAIGGNRAWLEPTGPPGRKWRSGRLVPTSAPAAESSIPTNEMV